ncbi:putative bifunctional diguanylate cyclase/phosphodiesterase [Thiobaca trueperi]|uniref:PAS domain S-box-containing protein/diguanylate cyclase (GGDEF)-like protein n=1 Tax=Thiobaca trueperi TaxID=127458 RepID=A0A4R3MRY7_9GAMM|nr:EAL domain-containing protein [Thiobaca trueperi]TCT19014.1 PAS domain S-box-containing protein/diguanylate cyclase (GGDEF)-like protein [Thiobaca trueperi]
MKPLRSRWHGSLLVRTGAVLVGVFLVLGAVTVTAGLHATKLRLQESSRQRLQQLLDTVESTASVACFANDEVLAGELASGLLKNSEVLSVTILAGDAELVSHQRHVSAQTDPDEAPAAPLVRDIHSPFDPGQRVGQLRLVPNHALIRQTMRHELIAALLQMALQLTVAALAVMAAMLMWIIRPIASISSTLHAMDATRGERLSVPLHHSRSEIGQLVTDVNHLADRLVQTLEEERALRLQREFEERRYHAIFDNAQTGLFLLNTAGALNSWNPSFARLLHLPPAASPAGLSLQALGWKTPERVRSLLRNCLNRPSSTSADLDYCAPDGANLWLHLVLTPIDTDALQGVLHDVTALKEAEASARRQAVTDPLTGIANRRGLEQRLGDLAQACAHGQISGFALMLVDFDNFKRINDGFGLPAGDEILKEATQRLCACVKSTDVVARLGADQFALLLSNLYQGEDAEGVALRVLHSLQQHYFIAGSPLKLHVSIGIAFYPRDATGDLPRLLLNAEFALDHAKAEGGNGMHFFNPELAAAAERRRQLENDLRMAIREEQFVLFFQPIVDLLESRISGAEVLIRWNHPQRGLVSPNEFIPLAEDTGLIIDIGLWALEASGRQLARWRTEGRELSLSLNVSGRQIPAGLPVEVLRDALYRLGFRSEFLALEITEGVLLDDVEGALNWLTAVRSQGFSIYLDDFGTGYSSLSYLKRFPVDRLKVDRSFVRDIDKDPSDRALVEAIVAMARSLSLEVVAEGVEEAEHVRLLHAMGCRYLQGFYFSPPVPLETFDDIHDQLPDMLGNALQGFLRDTS